MSSRIIRWLISGNDRHSVRIGKTAQTNPIGGTETTHSNAVFAVQVTAYDHDTTQNTTSGPEPGALLEVTCIPTRRGHCRTFHDALQRCLEVEPPRQANAAMLDGRFHPDGRTSSWFTYPVVLATHGVEQPKPSSSGQVGLSKTRLVRGTNSKSSECQTARILAFHATITRSRFRVCCCD